MSYEPWYDPCLLEPDESKQSALFWRDFADWRVTRIILNTGVEVMQQSHEGIVASLDGQA